MSVSVKESRGINELKTKLLDLVSEHLQELDLDLLCNARQIDCIQKAHQALRDFLDGLHQGSLEDDIIALDLKTCLLKLGEITGDEVSEEVLDGVFSRFCVGK